MSQTNIQDSCYSPFFLSAAHISLAVQFLAAVRNTQPCTKSHHLKPKDANDFEKIVANGGAMIAVCDANNSLISLALAKHDADKIGRIESVCITPAYRGLGLGGRMLALAEEWGITSGNQILQAKIAKDNVKSHSLFTGRGFTEGQEGFDAEGQYAFFIMQKNIA